MGAQLGVLQVCGANVQRKDQGVMKTKQLSEVSLLGGGRMENSNYKCVANLRGTFNPRQEGKQV